jgi:hypothetical protein
MVQQAVESNKPSNDHTCCPHIGAPSCAHKPASEAVGDEPGGLSNRAASRTVIQKQAKARTTKATRDCPDLLRFTSS